MKWMELPKELRDKLGRSKAVVREMKRAANAEKRRQTEIARAIEKREKRRRAEARRRKRPKPLDLVSPSRIRVEALAVAEKCRELGFLLDDLDGVRPCNRMSQRQIIEVALIRLEASLRRTLKRRSRERPEWSDMILKALSWTPDMELRPRKDRWGRNDRRKPSGTVQKVIVNGEGGDGDGRIVAADRFKPDTPAQFFGREG